MKVPAVTVALMLLAPSSGMGQARTADGIAAMFAGDYAAAARILQPLAEDPSDFDPLAAFFLATLYHSGKGAAHDEFHACGLYLKAAVPANPFAAQSLAIARTIHQDHPTGRQLCEATGNAIPNQAGSYASAAPAPQVRAGIDALTRGNYQSVASLLNPLVEAWPPPAAGTDFVMALLTETGTAVPMDRMRACTLYVRATVDNSHPFEAPAQVLFNLLQPFLTQEDVRRCVLRASVGLSHGFEPAMFTLEPGHSIALDIDGATITYQGKQTHEDLAFATSGAVFLPVKHTELASFSLPPERRHFIEFFWWVPWSTPRTWKLFWNVFEVVRERTVNIVGAELVTISAERPPTGGAIDTAAMARLRVNDEGLSMWEVLQGPEQNSEIIETEAERQQARDEERARKEADDKVNWALVRDVHRRPALVYAGAGGCGNVFVYGWSGDRTEAITIRADKDMFGLSTAPKTFDLAANRGLDVIIHVYERAMRHLPFCTDVGGTEGAAPETWTAVRGSLTIALSPARVRGRAAESYRATIQLVDAEFVNAAGTRVRLMQPVTLTAVVGWSAG